ncbi:SpoIID/LytB domain-containing protein [bacterium]|nr:SpoIID/LytB domain-containing protein [bacterium]
MRKRFASSKGFSEAAALCSLLMLLFCFSAAGFCGPESTEDGPGAEELKAAESVKRSEPGDGGAEHEKTDESEAFDAVAALKYPVRILLAVKKESFCIKAAEAVTPSFNEQPAASESGAEGKLYVNGRPHEGDSFEYSCSEGVTTLACSGARSALEFDGNIFRGCLELSGRGGRTEVVNVVALEDYLRGVVAKELLCSELEAMKAQAVAARTYAYARSGAAAGGWDLRCDTSSQVYGGIKAERSISDLAVEQTRGLVLAYNGSLASQALYHSACGGHTESSGFVYGTAPVEYLQGVECAGSEGRPACAASPYSFWRAEWSREELGQEIAEYLGRKAEAVRGIRILERGPSGRVSRLEAVFEDGGSAVLEREQIRRALRFTDGAGRRRNLPSLKFVVEADGFSQNLQFEDDDIPFPEAVFESGGEAENKSGSVVIVGSGWGHGVGMCQFGAMGLSALKFSFEDILKYYYSGTEVVCIDSLHI